MTEPEKVKQLIIDRQGSTEDIADRVLKKLDGLQPQLKPIFEKWIDDPNVRDETDYYGYSLDWLMDDYGLNFTGALLTLDWLLRDPETAVEALRTVTL